MSPTLYPQAAPSDNRVRHARCLDSTVTHIVLSPFMDKYPFGAATVHVEGDLTVSINDGPVNLAIVKDFLDLIESIQKEQGRCYLIVDASKIYPVSKEARRYLVEWSKTHQFTATAVFGAGVIMRAVFSVAGRAMNVRSRRAVTSAYFTATESEARAYINEHRQKLLANQAPTPSDAPGG